MPRPSRPFWSLVDTSGECWVWTGDRHRQGYGFWYAGGRQLAHRASYEMANGPVPDGLYILHRCDNPPCVRPDHLYAGTQRQNMLDDLQRRRPLRLTPEAVREIREQAAAGVSSPQLARTWNYGARSIRKIVSRELYAWVTP